MDWINALLEKNMLPDWLIRQGVRRLLRQRLAELKSGTMEERQRRFMGFIEGLGKSPIALNTQDANQQHYEVPALFFQRVLGKHLKYSCGYWPEKAQSLDDSETAMLELTCQRAQLENGQNILELGCGWGSLSLFMAERFPGASIVAVSNSASQKAFIDDQAEQRGLTNLEVQTWDMNQFHTKERFHRVVSVEMFEHMRNVPELLRRIHGWLEPSGQLLVHIFVHRSHPYLFEIRDESDWMARHFFTGGMMPSDHLLVYFQDHLKMDCHWQLSGTHYQKTCEAWLRRTTRHKNEILSLFREVYGQDQAQKWWVYWRIFFIACGELFGFARGEEWFVSHYRFIRRS